MRSVTILYASIGLALAAPHPQDIDLDAVVAAPDPVIVTPAVDVVSQVATVVPISSQAADASAAVATDPASTSTAAPDKRSVDMNLSKRDGTCAKQPVGPGPVASPDTPAAFASNTALTALATNAPTPYGYSAVFINQPGAVSASNYLGLYTLTSYDTLSCQSKCDQVSGCVSFNVYAERDPLLDPNAANCPNPGSTTNFKCTLWGVPVSSQQANNTGQWKDSFEVMITASNAYNKASPPSSVAGFSGPTELGGAINAPLDAQGYNTYMGYKFYPFSQAQGYNPQTCASACSSQTSYNKAHPAKDGTYQTCAFFNMYVLSEDGVAQGLYCSLYNETWAASYGTNTGQYRGSDRFTVSDSYSYSLMSDLDSAKSSIVAHSLKPFCSTLLGYSTPTVTITWTSTATGYATSTTLTTITTTTTSTSTSATTYSTFQFKRSAALSTPTVLASFAPSVVSAACSAEITPVTSTSTVYTSVTTTSTTTSIETDTATATATSIATTTDDETLYCGVGGNVGGYQVFQVNSVSVHECVVQCQNEPGCIFINYQTEYENCFGLGEGSIEYPIRGYSYVLWDMGCSNLP